jgi:hypothetical protein
MMLSAHDLVELTHRTKPAWQARALIQMGIPFRKRPDGTLVVLAEDLRQDEGKRAPRLRAG